MIRPIPNASAEAIIAGKPAVARAVFDRLLPELLARAFTITGVECVATIGRVRDIAARLPAGADWDATKAAMLAEISPWLAADPDDETRARQEAAAARRAELLLRMHGWQAYAQVQHGLMEEHRDAFPYRQYLASGDDRVRSTHAALDGKVLPADHAFWRNHTPPWEFNCRCDCVALTREDAQRMRDEDAGLPPEQRRVVEGAGLALVDAGNLVDPNSGGILDIRTPREKTGDGYEWRPGDARKSVANILESLAPDERSAFLDWAGRVELEAGRTLVEWLEGQG